MPAKAAPMERAPILAQISAIAGLTETLRRIATLAQSFLVPRPEPTHASAGATEASSDCFDHPIGTAGRGTRARASIATALSGRQGTTMSASEPSNTEQD